MGGACARAGWAWGMVLNATVLAPPCLYLLLAGGSLVRGDEIFLRLYTEMAFQVFFKNKVG